MKLWRPSRHLARYLALIFAVSTTSYGLSASAVADDMAARSITVSGEAERRVAPDMATLNMEIVKESTDAATARADADTVTNRALAIIAEAGVSPDDRDSSGLSVAPQYRWNKATQKQELMGYRVSRSVRVRLLDLEKLGSLLTDLSDAGVNRMDPPRLGLQQEEVMYQQVLADAAANARQRADTLARTLGESLGPVLQLTTQQNIAPRPMVAERAMMAADSAAPDAAASYQTGQLTYRVSLSATFALP